jgi:hypothetical protein
MHFVISALTAPLLWIACLTSTMAQPREPIPVEPIQGQFCRALAPAGWAIVDQDDRGSTVTLASADGQAKAA